MIASYYYFVSKIYLIQKLEKLFETLLFSSPREISRMDENIP
jgi:hypothetical protein